MNKKLFQFLQYNFLVSKYYKELKPEQSLISRKIFNIITQIYQ
ncbi:hypothetical protein pb186bvf_010720 [Paramecium bursaria]